MLYIVLKQAVNELPIYSDFRDFPPFLVIGLIVRFSSRGLVLSTSFPVSSPFVQTE